MFRKDGQMFLLCRTVVALVRPLPLLLMLMLMLLLRYVLQEYLGGMLLGQGRYISPHFSTTRCRVMCDGMG
jgi:hypothetical protein